MSKIKNKKALITGISGQDGSYLAELLLSKGYEVHGLVMHIDLEDINHRLLNIKSILDRVHLHPANLENFSSIFSLFEQIRPDECYHFAAQSFVDFSFDTEFSTFNVNVHGTHNILAAIKMLAPKCKMYFAGSSEMFGKVNTAPQDENTSFRPRSIYGISKAAGFQLAVNYREQYGLFLANGILYNHESERRGFQYVTRKISSGVARIKLGLENSLTLGNLDAKRDWGYAPEYVEAIWLMLQQDSPDDFVLGTGETHSVKEFVETAFACLDLDWQEYIKFDARFARPVEQVELRSNPAKAARILNWKTKTRFEDIVRIMVMNDFEQIQKRSS